MDTHYGTLNMLLENLASKNQMLGWNIYQQKNGNIVMKIRFDDHLMQKESINNHDMSKVNDENVTFKKVSSNQNHRNYHRAKTFREQLSTKPSHSKSISTEIPRNEHFSEPVQPSHQQEVSMCLSADSLSHADLDSESVLECPSPQNHNIATISYAEPNASDGSDGDAGSDGHGSIVKLDNPLDGDDVYQRALNTLNSLPKITPEDPVARKQYHQTFFANYAIVKPVLDVQRKSDLTLTTNKSMSGFGKLYQSLSKTGRLKDDG